MNPFEALVSSMAGVPILRGALCRGRHSLMDPQEKGEPDEVVAARHAQAIGLCGRCPALTDCRTWVDSLPPKLRPRGVIAGRVIAETKSRRKRTA
jgi:WhiB family redox-sensing transcriptional regulator